MQIETVIEFVLDVSERVLSAKSMHKKHKLIHCKVDCSLTIACLITTQQVTILV